MTYWLTGSEELDDPRFRKAGPAAIGLYVWSGEWCMDQVRYRPAKIPAEWFIPDHWVRSWPNGARVAARLVSTGLWERVEGGYRFGWIRPENTADHVRAERKRKATEKARQRAEKRLLSPPCLQETYRGDTPPDFTARDSRKKREHGDDQ